MLPTKDEIAKILKQNIFATPRDGKAAIWIHGISDVAIAIADLVTRARMMSEFVCATNVEGAGIYHVMDDESLPYIVMACQFGDKRISCHSQWRDELCSDSRRGDGPCIHVKAVRLHLAREEKS